MLSCTASTAASMRSASGCETTSGPTCIARSSPLLPLSAATPPPSPSALPLLPPLRQRVSETTRAAVAVQTSTAAASAARLRGSAHTWRSCRCVMLPACTMCAATGGGGWGWGGGRARVPDARLHDSVPAAGSACAASQAGWSRSAHEQARQDGTEGWEQPDQLQPPGDCSACGVQTQSLTQLLPAVGVLVDQGDRRSGWQGLCRAGGESGQAAGWQPAVLVL